MKRPAFQFYTADWRNNAKLRRCSPAARGIWMDVLCVLHDSDEYGVCRWPLADLANSANAPFKMVRELVDKDVLKGADVNAAPYVYTPRHAGKDGEAVTLVEPRDGPCWYSSRFVRDEWVRMRRGTATQFTEDNQPPPKPKTKTKPKAVPKGGIGDRQGDGSTSSSSPSEETTDAVASAAAASAGGAPPAKAEPPTNSVWQAYSTAYRVRYGAEPVRNRTVNGQLANFVTRIPADEAPLVATFFVQHNGGLYVSAMHPTNLLQRDAEKLRTEWATGRSAPASTQPAGKHAGFSDKNYREGVTPDGTFA